MHKDSSGINVFSSTRDYSPGTKTFFRLGDASSVGPTSFADVTPVIRPQAHRGKKPAALMISSAVKIGRPSPSPSLHPLQYMPG